MKYIIALVGLILFGWSCTTPPPPLPLPELFSATGFVFSEYSKKGFLFTPNNYDGDYESLGLVQVTYTPRANVVSAPVISDPLYKNWQKYRLKPDPLDPQKVIAHIYSICVEMGADALTQMKIEHHSVGPNSLTNNQIIDGIKISGFAIKRRGRGDGSD
ncbi:MAG: hypothetical protein IH971_11170 [Candidatus Marinimicrobia bacterium]|nr:hypothetical protein [Candidatus Neomarinimicrobiota bacterium]